MLKVNEIFKSIQGESSYAGYPCTFIRLTGCNLRCKYCDTTYAYEKGSQLAIDYILDRVDNLGCDLVEITGGEPLMQEDTPELISELVELKYEVLLETNGSYSLDSVHNKCVSIIDYKCPGSVLNEHYVFKGFPQSEEDEIKFVIDSRSNYEWAKREAENFPDHTINFSPVWGVLDAKVLAEWIRDDNLEVRLNLQLHKILWSSYTQGV